MCKEFQRIKEAGPHLDRPKSKCSMCQLYLFFVVSMSFQFNFLVLCFFLFIVFLCFVFYSSNNFVLYGINKGYFSEAFLFKQKAEEISFILLVVWFSAFSTSVRNDLLIN